MSDNRDVSILSALRMLSERDGCSLEDLASGLGVGLESARDLVTALESAGMLVKHAHDAGLRLVGRFVPLDRETIVSGLGAPGLTVAVEVVEQTGSTNDDLMARARQGEDARIVRVAELQTAGRGRHQRRWLSAPGSALTFSLLWRFDCEPGQLSGLSLAVGVALARSLRALGAGEVKLKWPNDLVWRERKLGGTLIETIRNAGAGTCAVIGIGINVTMPEHLLQRIDQPAVDLLSIGVHVDRNRLLVSALSELHTVLDVFAQDGFESLRQDWQLMHAYQDKMVRLQLADGCGVEGRVIGVDDRGALLLEMPDGLHSFLSGELSMRPLAKA